MKALGERCFTALEYVNSYHKNWQISSYIMVDIKSPKNQIKFLTKMK